MDGVKKMEWDNCKWISGTGNTNDRQVANESFLFFQSSWFFYQKRERERERERERKKEGEEEKKECVCRNEAYA